MRKYRLIIQPPAFDDLDAAYEWIRERSPDVAVRWFNGFVAALDSLTQSPERCGLAPENEAVEPEIRQLLYGRRGGVYRALFTIVGRDVRVIHIRHAAREGLSPEELTPSILRRRLRHPFPLNRKTAGVAYKIDEQVHAPGFAVTRKRIVKSTPQNRHCHPR